MTQTAGSIISNWTLGSTSVQYETGGRGVATISSGNGDKGGASYGAYQLSSATGTLSNYLNSSKYGGYGQYFIGLAPGTAAFNTKWTKLAQNDLNFSLSQHAFIQDTHYSILLSKLMANGIDMSNRGVAVQDMLWSTSVQFGGNTSLVINAIQSKYGVRADVALLSDSNIIECIQDYKIQNNDSLFKSSSDSVKYGTLKRAISEKNSLLNLAKIEMDAKNSPLTDEVTLSNENLTGISTVTTTLSGAADAGMYTATEITNTQTGEVQYLIRHNGTDEAIASGSSYVVNANDTITTTSGDAKFTHALSDGRLRVMQSADGSGFVVGKEGDDFYFDAGSTVTLQPDGSVKVHEPLVNGGYNDYNVLYGEQVVKASDTNGDKKIDQTTTTTQVTDTAQEVKVEDGAGNVVTDTMTEGGNTYDLQEVADRVEVEHVLSPEVKANNVDVGYWHDFTLDTSDMIVVDIPVSPVYVPPTYWAEPWVPFDMGAFYESVSTKNDLAKSIAASTPVVLDANQHGISAAQLAARDSNADGQLSGTELSNLSLWKDLNENGFIETGELTAVATAVSAMNARDYGFYTSGNTQRGAGVVGTPVYGGTAPIVAVPNSNYDALRNSDNYFYLGATGAFTYTVNWTANQIKINYNNRSYMIGTSGNDSFDGSYYAGIPSYQYNLKNATPTNFLAGAGDDVMGGSSRNDNLWGGTGNDTVVRRQHPANSPLWREVACAY
jgi:hypothetical protein